MSTPAPSLAAAARTHVGHRRKRNEDTFVCSPERGLFAVIDGMGGQQAGDVAAALTRREVLAGAARGDELRAFLERANETIYDESERTPARHGMGCVATVARVAEGELELVHVGDTRALLASRDGCEQLTRDHTVAAELREACGLSDADLKRLPGRHQVTRDIGGKRHHDDSTWIDSVRVPFAHGDVLLLCSDGLSDLCDDRELFHLLGRARAERRAPPALVDQLIELALERGAPDNVTVVAVRRATPPTERVPTLRIRAGGGSALGRAARHLWRGALRLVGAGSGNGT